MRPCNRRRVAEERLSKVRAAGLDNIKFAWMGSVNEGEPHYYRIQGPTFLIEYDNVQNEANHAHSVWRDFDGDFGRDLLAAHYRQFPPQLVRQRGVVEGYPLGRITG